MEASRLGLPENSQGQGGKLGRLTYGRLAVPGLLRGNARSSKGVKRDALLTQTERARLRQRNEIPLRAAALIAS
jgi:hypothetical protein